MAVDAFVSPQDANKTNAGKITTFVFLTCLLGATSGLIFGYDIGISGGVTSMESFLHKFFPSVYEKMKRGNNTNNHYCNFNSQVLTTFTSSLYLAALVASLFASTVTRVFGRKRSMFAGGLIFLAGSAINGAAQNLSMLIIGRILLGVGVGFACQSAPLYLSEMAPANLRGMLNIGLQLMITIGIFTANLVNYATSKIKSDWSWRISLALAAVPAIIITVGAFFLPDTPNSLVARGQSEKGMVMLQKIRGTENVTEEFSDLVSAIHSKMIEQPWINIFKRKYRPQLIMAIMLPSLQQLTGINAIMFYAPVLFKTIGFGSNTALVSAVIIGLVNMFATLVSISTVDKFGRRILYLIGGPQMLICQIIVGTLIAIEFGNNGEGKISELYAKILLAFVCTYVCGFAWSWGPLTCLVPSEIFPMEIRSAAQSITISVNMLFTFFIAQAFLPMLCHMKYGIFYFFAGSVAVMTVFIYLFLPETKNIPIERMELVWRDHWFWGKFVVRNEDAHDVRQENRRGLNNLEIAF